MATLFGIHVPFSGNSEDDSSDENQEQHEKDLQEIHKSLDSDEDPWTSCGDSNTAGKD